MAIFQDLIYARPMPQYVPLPVAQFEATAGALQDRYDTNLAATDKLQAELANMDARDINRPLLQSITDRARQQLDQIAEAGDYENAASTVRRVARELGNDSLLRAILQDKQAYDAYNKGLEGIQKDIKDPQRLIDARAYSQAMNTKPVELGPNGEYLNVFSGYTPVATPDISKQVTEFMGKIKADGAPAVVGKDKDGKPIYMRKINNAYYVEGHEKGLSEVEAAQMIAKYMANDPTISAYYQEGYMFDRFRNKYNRDTGEYMPYTVDDFGGEEVFRKAAEAANLDPDAIMADPDKIDKLYKSMYVNTQIVSAAEPYGQAAGFSDVEYKYHQDPEFLNAQRSQLALNNSLKELAAKEAADKRMLDYKYQKEKEEKDRELALTTMGVVPTEPVMNYAVAQENIGQLQTDLKKLEQKEALAKNPGSGVQFSPSEMSQKVEIQNKLRALQAEQKFYMQTAALTQEGLQAIDDQWRAYEKASGGRTEISKNDFYNFAKRGEFPEPAKVKTPQIANSTIPAGGFMAGFSTTELREGNDPKDYRTYLKKAERELSKRADVMKATNEQMKALDQQGYFGFFTGTTGGTESDIAINPKVQAVDRVSKALSRQVYANGGVGYDVIGTGDKLDNILRKAQISLNDDNETATKNGKKLKVQTIPLTPTGSKDVMYQMVFSDPKTGEMINSFRVMPENQAFHADLMRDLNSEIANAYDENTEIGKTARTAIALYDLPQFNMEQDLKVLDSEVTEKTNPGILSVGAVRPLPEGNWVAIKQNAMVPKEFKDGRPVAVKQGVYQLVRIKDNVPPDVVINNDNISQYLYDATKSVAENAILNSKRSTEALGEEQAYAIKDRTYATGFASLNDAMVEYYKNVRKGKF